MKKPLIACLLFLSYLSNKSIAQILLKTRDNAHEGGITALCLSSDAGFILTGGNDMKTYMWNSKTFDKKGALKCNDKVSSLAINGNNRFYVSGSADMKIRVFDIEQNMPTRILSEHTAEITAISINPINDFIASGSKDNAIKIWDNTKSKTSILTIKGHQKEITALAYSPDGKLLFSSSADNTIKFWDATSGELKKSLETTLKGVTSLTISSDGKYIAAGGKNGTIIIYTYTGEKVIELVGYKSEITTIGISGDGQYVAGGGKDKEILIWRLDNGQIEKNYMAHDNFITGLVFSSDGEMLVSASLDGSIKEWDMKDLNIGKKKFIKSDVTASLSCNNLIIIDENENGILEGGEKASISFIIENQGRAPAYNIMVKPSLENFDANIKLEKEYLIGNLDVGKKQTVKIQLNLGTELQAGNNSIQLAIIDGNEASTSAKLSFQTNGSNSYSYIMVLGQSYYSATGKAEIGAPITVKIKIKNITKGDAKNFKINFLLPENIFATNKLSETISSMTAGEEKEIQMEFYAAKTFTLPEIKMGIDLQGVAFTNAKDIILKVKMNEKLPLSEDYSSQVLAQSNEIVEKESIDKTPLMRGNSADPMSKLNVKISKQMIIGNYYALLIGIDKYKSPWANLSNAVNDAKALEKTLRASYKFDNFKTLYNEQANRDAIIKELEWLVANVKENDNVFIYYSGHGDFKKELNRGYWVPIDAENSSTSKYISNADIQTYINGIKSKHTLLVSDACFSGDIFRGNTITTPFEETEKYYKEVHNLVSRQALTSGGIEPVMDGGKEGHSVFAYYLLKTLESNQGKYFDASQLYTKIKIPVINNSEQTPKFSPIKNAGDEGGQFIFIKK
jgi:hypothetical protein